MTEQLLKSEAYRLYQLDWMAAHGYSIADVVMSVCNSIAADSLSTGVAHAAELFAEWENDCGLNGEIWACEAEFFAEEFLDREYMLKLLPSEMISAYLKLSIK